MARTIKEIVDRLVDQFSDPFAFLRELVQNSLDAGSPEIEFEFHYAANGTTVLLCSDTGEGMDEQAIDTRLTRIFASSKDDDLTKIGKFGIGFLSLFALKPNDVVVDTGRSGRSWRIHFHIDRTFSKTPLPEPVDGTRIRWVKRQSRAEHTQFRNHCKDALQRWCKYAQAKITVDGESIGQPFPWDHPLGVYHRQPGTEVALRPCPPKRGWVGFYNQGLTLAELEEPLVAGVDVKISSRYLEHTLTRDSVQRDENFSKACQIVDQVVREQLLPALLAAVAKGKPGRLHEYLSAHLKLLSKEQKALPVLAGFESHYSLLDLSREAADHGLFLFSAQADELVERLHKQGRRVLHWKGPISQPGPEILLRALAVEATCAEVHEVFALPHLIKPDARQQTWLRRVRHILSEYQAIWLAHFPPEADHRAYLVCHQSGQPVPLKWEASPGKALQLVVNVAHQSWSHLWELEEDWGVAAICQPLWTVFPGLARTHEAKNKMVERVLGQTNSS